MPKLLPTTRQHDERGRISWQARMLNFLDPSTAESADLLRISVWRTSRQASPRRASFASICTCEDPQRVFHPRSCSSRRLPSPLVSSYSISSSPFFGFGRHLATITIWFTQYQRVLLGMCILSSLAFSLAICTRSRPCYRDLPLLLRCEYKILELCENNDALVERSFRRSAYYTLYTQSSRQQ